MKKPVIIFGFVLMAIAQWYVPAKMIFYRERIITTGKEFRFKTEPFDPYDAFRGKYVYLVFHQTAVQLRDTTTRWNTGDEVYALLETDSSGFAKVTTVTKDEPGEHVDYLKVTTGYVYQDSVTSLSFNYPFDRFYMEESKAAAANDAYNDALRDTSKVTYALVRVLRGEGVVLNVMIDGVPIKDVAVRRQKQEDEAQ